MTKKTCVLIIENDFIELSLLKEILSADYEIYTMADGNSAQKFLAENSDKITLVLLDIYLPVMSGFEVLAWRAENSEIADIPFICITGSHDPQLEGQVFRLGAEDFILKPYSSEVVKARVKAHVKLRLNRLELSEILQENLLKLTDLHNSILTKLTSVSEHPTQSNRARRTKALCELLINQISKKEWYNNIYSKEDTQTLRDTCILFEERKKSASKTARNTSTDNNTEKKSLFDQQLAEKYFINDEKFALHFCNELSNWHHEWWDGSGYPHGLKGDKIPLSSRILALVDVIDTLLGEHMYKKPLSVDFAFNLIKCEAASHFDPTLVQALLEIKLEVSNLYQSF